MFLKRTKKENKEQLKTEYKKVLEEINNLGYDEATILEFKKIFSHKEEQNQEILLKDSEFLKTVYQGIRRVVEPTDSLLMKTAEMFIAEKNLLYYQKKRKNLESQLSEEEIAEIKEQIEKNDLVRKRIKKEASKE